MMRCLKMRASETVMVIAALLADEPGPLGLPTLTPRDAEGRPQPDAAGVLGQRGERAATGQPRPAYRGSSPVSSRNAIGI